MQYDLSGVWNVEIEQGQVLTMQIPGTLDENGIGYKDTGSNQWHPDAELGNAEEGFKADAPIATRFTRKVTFEGEAKIYKKVTYTPTPGKRVFIEVERARCLKLLVDGIEVADFIPPSISTPHVFEVTGLLHGENEITFLSDNSYPGLPHDDIVYSSAATDETQTNWNGLLGRVRIYEEEPVFMEHVSVFPKGNEAEVLVVVQATDEFEGVITLTSDCFVADKCVTQVTGIKGRNEYRIKDVALKEDVRRWDEYEGELYELEAVLAVETAVVNQLETKTDCKELSKYHDKNESKKTISFGIRDFGDDGTGRLALNGRRIFIRSEANCAVFPEKGYSPVTVNEWMDILQMYKSYGVNMMRFHSHCPSEAAFIAADRIGMLMQPELSFWNPKNALESEEGYAYYKQELAQILVMLSNHPSFVMLTLGNELHCGDLGMQRMKELVSLAQQTDTTRLYANGSNAFYGEKGCDEQSDFYTSQKFYKEDIRGTFAAFSEDGIEGYINREYPSACHNYDASMKSLRESFKKPVFTFEVGQFEVLPDFDELEDFKGVTLPVNYELVKKKVEEKGLLPMWKRYVEATGELSRIGYREEVEAVLRTKELSGISLLGIQDFPGQGTALVGMLNAHLQPKPFDFAKPERFQSFFREQLPLVLLPKYTWLNTETLTAEIVIANYGKEDVIGCWKVTLIYKEQQHSSINEGCRMLKSDESVCAKVGEVTSVGKIEIPLDRYDEPVRLDLEVTFGDMINTYPIWVYPQYELACSKTVYEARRLDEKALSILASGGKVFLAPGATKAAMPHSIKTQFTTDFWSVGTFPAQEGGMGQLIDVEHPIFTKFPTEFHTNWQWWPMAVSRAMILPRQMKAIVTELDSYAYLRPMAQLLEVKIGEGKLMLSTMGLHQCQQYPEARALLNAIYEYMDSDVFMPKQEMTVEELKALFE